VINAASSNSTASEYEEEEGEEGQQQQQQQQQRQRSLLGGGSIKGAAVSKRPIKRPGSAGGGPADGLGSHTDAYSAAAAAAYQRFSHPGVLTEGTAGAAMYSTQHAGQSYVMGGGSSSGVGFGDARVQPVLSRFAPYSPGMPVTVPYQQHHQQQQGLQMQVEQSWEQQQQQQRWAGQTQQQQYPMRPPGPWDQQPQQQQQQQQLDYQQQRQQHYQQLQQRTTAFRGPSGVAAAAAAAPSTAVETYLPPLHEQYNTAAGAAEYQLSNNAGSAGAMQNMPEQHSAPPKLHATASGTFLVHGAAIGGRFSDVGGPAAAAAKAAAAAAGVGEAGMPHCWSYPVSHTMYTQQEQQQQQQTEQQRGSSIGMYSAPQSQQQQQQQQQQEQQAGYHHHHHQEQQQPRLLSTSASDSHLIAHTGSAPLPYADADVAAHTSVAVSPHPGSTSPTPLPQRPQHSSYPGQLPPPPKQQLWPAAQQQQQQQQNLRCPEFTGTVNSREAKMNSLRAAMQAAAAAAAAAGGGSSNAATTAAAAAGAGVSTAVMSPFSMAGQQVQLKGVSFAEEMVCSAAGSPCISAAGMLGTDLGGINLGPGWQQQQQAPQQQQQPNSSWTTEQQQQQLMVAGSSGSAGAAAHKADPAAAAPNPAYGSAATGSFPVPESDMFRGMSGGDEDFSELFDLLLEGTEQQ
jgi:hypothetical protein